MTASIAQAPTALDDAIIRNAEATLETVGRAREAIHSGHLRPGTGGRPDARSRFSPAATAFWSAFRASPRRSWSRPWASCSGLDARRVQFTPDLMPSDILGSEILDEGAGPPALVPVREGTDLRPAPDGGRDQPRQPAHPVGAAAGHAGASRLGRRRAARPAAALPRAGDAEPHRAGGHLSAARGAARPLPAARSTSAIRIAMRSAAS